MIPEKFNRLVHDFSLLPSVDADEIQQLTDRYPYCQLAHIFQAKKAQIDKDPRFEEFLKTAAAAVYDREVLHGLMDGDDSFAIMPDHEPSPLHELEVQDDISKEDIKHDIAGSEIPKSEQDQEFREALSGKSDVHEIVPDSEVDDLHDHEEEILEETEENEELPALESTDMNPESDKTEKDGEIEEEEPFIHEAVTTDDIRESQEETRLSEQEKNQTKNSPEQVKPPEHDPAEDVHFIPYVRPVEDDVVHTQETLTKDEELVGETGNVEEKVTDGLHESLSSEQEETVADLLQEENEILPDDHSGSGDMQRTEQDVREEGTEEGNISADLNEVRETGDEMSGVEETKQEVRDFEDILIQHEDQDIPLPAADALTDAEEETVTGNTEDVFDFVLPPYDLEHAVPDPEAENTAAVTEGEVEQEEKHLADERHTFAEWLRIIAGSGHAGNSERPLEEKAFDEADAGSLAEQSISPDRNLASETYASLLAAQGKKKAAADMYERLRLKFPEKSAYFASRIEELRG